MQRESGVRASKVIVVSGAPGSGKTTLAARLASEIGIPLLSRDALKELLCDVLGAPNVRRSQDIGAAAYAVLYDVLGRLVDARAAVVVESNFRRGQAERDLRPFIGRSDMLLIHCAAPRATILGRYEERAASGLRHAAHHDAARLGALRDDLTAGRFEPLDLQVPTLTVETSSGYRPPFTAVLEFVGERLSVGLPA